MMDQGIACDAVLGLHEHWYECTHVSQIGMANSDDDEILAKARERQEIIVTLDADFHAILAVSGASGPSVVRIRIEGLHATDIVRIIRGVFARFGADLKDGALVTVKARKIRCHKLPIGRID
jgi:predicted nuclease of predicted toxin-antitoxin system